MARCLEAALGCMTGRTPGVAGDNISAGAGAAGSSVGVSGANTGDSVATSGVVEAKFLP